MQNKSKKGQVAVWIVIGMAIVAVILIIFALSNRPSGAETDTSYNPTAYIKDCVKKEVLITIDKILPHGGFVNPTNYKVYNNISIEYLCKNNGNYLSCINQHPAYIDELRSEIKNDIFEEVEECYLSLQDALKERDVDMSFKETTLAVDLAPGRISVHIEKEIKITEKESSQTIEKIDVQVPSKIYDLANTAIDIVNNEAVYCYFEYVGYMMLYPELVIEKKALDDSTKIYSVEDIASKKKLTFAVRGCAIPAGI